MPVGDITYSLVANGTTVLAEGYSAPGKFTVIARRILTRIPANNAHKKSYTYDGSKFHYICDENGLICMCMSDDKILNRKCFAFLTEIRSKFLGSYENEYRSGTELSFNDRFTRELRQRMDYYSNDPKADKIDSIIDDIEDITDVMKDNIGKALDRGDRMETLVDQTGKLETGATHFRRGATKLKTKMWWKNTRMWILLFIIIGIVTAVVVIVALLVTKGPL
eukprot:TRINITY_DN2149_c0_g1_i1.p1 TRINITY_DN2149_c0_g1~~TRINITY_DN2149_c0_g1_i1.p1  ORF type:complete len:222 (+),score=71.01 TRINITY_DN2149_c0_g1_i1:109-774(+)